MVGLTNWNYGCWQLIDWFSNRTGTSVDDGKVRGKDKTLLLVPNLPLCHWSSQLFNLHVLSSTDFPVLLLNQPNIKETTVKSIVTWFCCLHGKHQSDEEAKYNMCSVFYDISHFWCFVTAHKLNFEFTSPTDNRPLTHPAVSFQRERQKSSLGKNLSAIYGKWSHSGYCTGT